MHSAVLTETNTLRKIPLWQPLTYFSEIQTRRLIFSTCKLCCDDHHPCTHVLNNPCNVYLYCCILDVHFILPLAAQQAFRDKQYDVIEGHEGKGIGESRWMPQIADDALTIHIHIDENIEINNEQYKIFIKLIYVAVILCRYYCSQIPVQLSHRVAIVCWSTISYLYGCGNTHIEMGWNETVLDKL